ncbi:MAG: hydantoinase/oxoprolinase family protein [Chloroflexota bacterium]|nr:hydantoinase/oxoprolinase family protein [Chloroflexota bacterium]
MFLGVDVGGTNTDAVLMDGQELRAAAKVPTSEDVTSGIVDAISELLRQGIDSERVAAVMVGTTHFTNALLEHKGLCPTGVIRLALPATQLLPPLVDWDDDLKNAMGGLSCMVGGGNEFDGREIAALDRDGVCDAAQRFREQGVRAIAVSGVFSPVDPSHEKEAGALIREIAPDMRVCLSYENGRMGLLERENAAVLNACLADVAVSTVKGIEGALQRLGIAAPLFMSQNDGTLMDTDFASQFPVLTVSSGPTNSMRGAAYLSGIADGIVVDIGGTSTDVGALVKGFPRESAVAVDISGVRTNFRTPDMVSVALGGGTVVEEDPLRMGPESVGYRLTDRALVFGGDTLTTTDIAVASGRARLGDWRRLGGMKRAVVQRCVAEIEARAESAVDRVKLSRGDMPVVLVGGGNILLSDTLAGASQVLRPKHAEVANAIGAAIAQIGGQVERVYSLEGSNSRDEAIADCKAAAIRQAVTAGAEPSSIEVVDVEEVPLTYVPSNATRVRVKAVGSIAPDRLGQTA